MPNVDRASQDGCPIWPAGVPVGVPCPRCQGLMWTDGKACWCSDVRCDPLANAPVKAPTKGSR